MREFVGNSISDPQIGHAYARPSPSSLQGPLSMMGLSNQGGAARPGSLRTASVLLAASLALGVGLLAGDGEAASIHRSSDGAGAAAESTTSGVASTVAAAAAAALLAVVLMSMAVCCPKKGGRNLPMDKFTVMIEQAAASRRKELERQVRTTHSPHAHPPTHTHPHAHPRTQRCAQPRSQRMALTSGLACPLIHLFFFSSIASSIPCTCSPVCRFPCSPGHAGGHD